MIAVETQTIAGGVTAPAGFRASGVSCGIKKNGNPDPTPIGDYKVTDLTKVS